MTSRYDILFEPMKIGPVTAKTVFIKCRIAMVVAIVIHPLWQQCANKGEGGWGVIFTEQVEIHHSSDCLLLNYICGMTTISRCSQMADAMHSHDALAGIELAYSGINGPISTKEVPLAVSRAPY